MTSSAVSVCWFWPSFCAASMGPEAVSAFAQTVEDVDRAYEIELKAVEAMERSAARS